MTTNPITSHDQAVFVTNAAQGATANVDIDIAFSDSVRPCPAWGLRR